MQIDPLVMGLEADQAEGGGDRFAGVEAFAGEFEPLGLDLGHVEDVVDQVEQMAASLVDQVGVFEIALGQGAEHPLAHHVREAEDSVQRRAQFVRHVGEKAGLALMQGLRLQAGGFQRGLAGLLVGDVAQDRQQAFAVQRAKDDLEQTVQGATRMEGRAALDA